jgi:integrase
LLFTSKTGERLNGANWKRDVRWTKHAEGRRVHDLRHTAATLWLRNGIDLKTVQHWLGQASARMTANVYTHWMGTDADAAAMAKFSQVLEASGDTTGTQPGFLRDMPSGS